MNKDTTITGASVAAKVEGKRLVALVDDKSKNRLKEDSKQFLNKYNFNNKKRGKGFVFGVNNDQVLGDINEKFIDACENGDYPTVTRILDALKDFNIDVTDNLGRTALRLAVENEHLEVVQALLGKSDSQKMREALLLAIYLGHIQIAESILRHPKYKVLNEKKFVNEDTDAFWQTPSSDDAQFSPDMTPLILASQYNRTEIVQMLLLSGDRIIKPHDYHCKCNECSNKFKFDSLRHAQSRLNAYRGLASESYISLASLDPILTAFELGHELKLLAQKEKYFKNEYNTLAENLSQYAVKLLNNVRGRDELEIVLNKTGKETEEKYERLARLDLALKYQEKPFVAHSNCQQKLVEIWNTGIRKITKMNQLFVILFLCLFILLMPFLFMLYIVAPKWKVSRFLCQPCVKFVAHTITYLVFILMILISSLQFADEEKNRERFSSVFSNYSAIFLNYTNNTDLQYRFMAPDLYIRAHKPSNLDIAITIWIVGFFWHESKQIYQDGIRDYLLSWNNIVDSCMVLLYLSSFALKYYTLVTVSMEVDKISDPSFWNIVSNLTSSDNTTQIKVYEVFYWLNDDRYYWYTFDPINMAEGLFAIANIFSICRICFLLPANQHLGPLQISLGRMISDIMKFVFIFLIIFAAFMFALNNLFWYYQSNTRSHVEIVPHFTSSNETTTNAEQSFGTITVTFQTIFWSIFGLGSSTFVDLAPFENTLTENFGYAIYGAFHIASIIILLNMLIAMMTKSYEAILRQSDIEWKFARSKLYMEFIKDGATLPVPFNTIPTPKSLFYLVRRIVRFICCMNKKKNDNNNTNLNEIEEVPPVRGKGKPTPTALSPINNKPMNGAAKNGGLSNGHAKKDERRLSLGGNDLTYTKVMQRIVKRFLLHKQRESDDIKESDFDELKQDLQMVRYEILNDIKKSEEETIKYISVLHSGISVLGEEVLQEVNDGDVMNRFKEFKYFENEFRDSIETVDADATLHRQSTEKSQQSFDRHSISYEDSLNSLDNSQGLQLFKGSLPNLSASERTHSVDSLERAVSTLCITENEVDSSSNNASIYTINLESIKIHSTNELHVIKEEEENSIHSPENRPE